MNQGDCEEKKKSTKNCVFKSETHRFVYKSFLSRFDGVILKHLPSQHSSNMHNPIAMT